MELDVRATHTELINRPSQLRLNWYRFRKNPLTLIGGIVLLLFIIIAVAAPLLTPYEPEVINMENRLAPPSMSHWFGTDEVGRDVLTRIIYGARLSLGMGITVVVIAGLIGTIIGAFAGYMGGKFGQIIMRIMDVILAFPTLVLAMALTAALGPSLINAMLAIAIVKIPAFVRLARSEALVVREQLFVKASKTFGLSDIWIIFRHIIPNVITPVIIQVSIDLGDAIMLIATLGFLGLGAQPPIPEWGTMVHTGWEFFMEQWWYATFPGIAIFLATVSFNLLGDGLRDVLDPKSIR
ncbi:ABC transporter permease [Virgibacillus litoralis]|uniref:Peptide/nickel transport system permease protein n=1 Tax=Virgibacillus litoralis TaxID=578221 RepID=A0ABS4HBQ6_9BACI|nr:ABC transporter permease subunit [Virgibacillus litoralis]MBP1948330.1 peptide/nickel transport system permease protein [Virgibacillus litoralis]